ncbi:MAG: (d)CMP kinase [Gemmatimonadetes bacterium]|nr:(d)CMP kinase [Gemmatimonadota bacterium]
MEGGAARSVEVIAIDGPAGSGKSTTAQGVARALGFTHVESGAWYRAAALLALRRGLASESTVDGPAVAHAFETCLMEAAEARGTCQIRLDGEDVSAALRSPEVAALVSRVAAEPAVRHVVTERLRSLAGGLGLVMDGRDIGSVVFPEARLKVFLDASVEERARRRSAGDGRDVAPATLDRRDALDRGRAVAPLAVAPDAELIVADDLTLPQQVELVVRLYHEALTQRRA